MKRCSIPLLAALLCLGACARSNGSVHPDGALMSQESFQPFLELIKAEASTKSLESPSGFFEVLSNNDWQLRYDPETFSYHSEYTEKERLYNTMSFLSVNRSKNIGCIFGITTLDEEGFDKTLDVWGDGLSDKFLAESFFGLPDSFYIPEVFFRDGQQAEGNYRSYSAGYQYKIAPDETLMSVLFIELNFPLFSIISCNSRFELDYEERAKLRNDVRQLIKLKATVKDEPLIKKARLDDTLR